MIDQFAPSNVTVRNRPEPVEDVARREYALARALAERRINTDEFIAAMAALHAGQVSCSEKASSL